MDIILVHKFKNVPKVHSQKEVADYLGIHYSVVRRLLKG